MVYLGAFAVIFFMLLGFWMLIFLGSFIPVMATLIALDTYNPELAAKLCDTFGINIPKRS